VFSGSERIGRSRAGGMKARPTASPGSFCLRGSGATFGSILDPVSQLWYGARIAQQNDVRSRDLVADQPDREVNCVMITPERINKTPSQNAGLICSSKTYHPSNGTITMPIATQG